MSAVPASRDAVGALLRIPHRGLRDGAFAREVALPALAVLVIVVPADIRLPIGLPGHRGLVWLTSLVVVALVTHSRPTVVAVGAASTMATQVLHTAPGLQASSRYLAAAVLLYVVTAIPVVRRQQWLVAVAAAPIHLVTLAGSVRTGFGGAGLFGSLPAGLAEKVQFHLGFGLAAGLLGWGLASGMNHFAFKQSNTTRRDPLEGTRCHGAESRSRGIVRNECGGRSHHRAAGGRARRGGVDDLSRDAARG
jgi:hypothetical protein